MKKKATEKLLWSGRFTAGPDARFGRFSASRDLRLWRDDIEGTRIQARTLCVSGLLTKNALKRILSALDRIEAGADKKGESFFSGYEDIHSAVENMLVKLAGREAGMIHAGRSRNDQISLDMRLFVKRSCLENSQLLSGIVSELKKLGKRYSGVLMPGYTHLQHAIPVRLSRYLEAHAEALSRDAEGFNLCARSADSMPLGSGALAGTTLAIDRKHYLRFSGFGKLTANTMDAVSDRDFLIEYVYRIALSLVHFSRFAEDMVIWSTSEFGFLELPDAFSSGSSMMPQKKNPDVFELVRGKSARGISALTGLLTLMKALPMTYNRDMQEDKEYLFGAHDVFRDVAGIMTPLVPALSFNTQRMTDELDRGFIDATSFCETLVRAGVPFREAHRMTGRLVRTAVDQGKKLRELDKPEIGQVVPGRFLRRFLELLGRKR